MTHRDGAALLVGLACAAAWPVLFVARASGLAVGAALALLSCAAAVWRRRELAALPAVTALAAVLATVAALMGAWPAPLFLAAAAGLALDRFRAPWLARGELGGRVAGWILAVVALSASALVAWWLLLRPDGSHLPALPTGLHPALLAAAVVSWSVWNAATEELYFRGALQHALGRTLGSGGVVVQAVAFGAMHFRGFPSGWSGLALATIFGMMAGVLRRRARGLLAPWVAHVAADLTIVAIRLLALP